MAPSSSCPAVPHQLLAAAAAAAAAASLPDALFTCCRPACRPKNQVFLHDLFAWHEVCLQVLHLAPLAPVTSWAGQKQVPRRALAAVAALLEARRHAVLLALLSEDAGACAPAAACPAAGGGPPSSAAAVAGGGALAQRLVALADAVTRGNGGAPSV